MDVREKLIGLIAKAKYICANDYSDHTEDEYIADTLLDNGVTVQKCGEWVQHCFEIECINCHQEALRDSFNKYVFSNYCPHCGAKMMPQPPKGE